MEERVRKGEEVGCERKAAVKNVNIVNKSCKCNNEAQKERKVEETKKNKGIWKGMSKARQLKKTRYS